MGGDGAGGTPFVDELVGGGGFQLGGGVPVLGEDCGEGEGLEVGDEGGDVLEGDGGHGGEVVLHVDYEESGGHFGGGSGRIGFHSLPILYAY